ncbi:FGGY-family carbohydrate kinase [Candidatus Kirkpatrickella diaphorinae]|uniref:FGGY-family carbohydrate kinase n=1 Tax=Candidatus Kirkpatrickella diaphorinae TaxID=2984322 RepID=A0ABY6GKQ6_9PROT|nr:FGGY-family carbohydrate kinase [Candidatus Kirkpatrickella diaphorinae]UYH51912.1 FGGY-family carbohydrate kinase [Candidatus Kirkpatrickella diaphorinae]
MDVVIGIDVGTGSARAGIFDLSGIKLASAVVETQTWRPLPDFIQQSSENIWQAVCQAVREAMGEITDSTLHVCGIGFDATCSMVVRDKNGESLSVDPQGAAGQDVILWADHRALAETAEINAKGDDVLRYVGGVISPEMETPKLLWIKRHLPQIYQEAGYFFDLPDFLTWRATGSDARSSCSVTCKWTYLAHENRWSASYFEKIGLTELVDEDFRRIGQTILPIGEHVGDGLTAQAASELGLPEGIKVGVSIIDGHAGGIGLLGIADEKLDFDAVINKRVAMIAGTSNCHMAVSPEARFIDGVWGPYYQAMIPEMWLTEAGQSAAGALIDFNIKTHAAFPALKEMAAQENISIYEALNGCVQEIEAREGEMRLTRRLHVLPDYNGNRAPHANPESRGAVLGLSLSAELRDLAALYLATIQGLAYGTRDIIEALNVRGYAIDTIIATGGGTKNPIFLREHANATNCRIILPKEPDSVLLGSAILGAMAAGRFKNFPEAMAAMSQYGTVIYPEARSKAFHDAKYAIFKRIYAGQENFRSLMAPF